MKILFLSHTRRNSVFKVGSHHLAREFAQSGHNIMYISTAVSPAHIIQAAIKPYLRDEIISRLRLTKPHFDICNDAKIIDYVPFSIVPYCRLPILDSDFVATKLSTLTFPRWQHVLRRLDFDMPDLVLVDEPSLIYMHSKIKAHHWVYRATDLYADMPGAKKSISKLQDRALRVADTIIATAQPVADYISERCNRPVHVIENGVQFDHFQTPTTLPPEYSQSPLSHRIVYIGSLDDRFDWNTVINAASAHPQSCFFIIGPGDRIHRSTPKNIHILGPRNYEQIPSYLQHADVGILPLTKGYGNASRSPMKLFEYGAAGLPVVATATPELERRKLPFVLLASTPLDFANAIDTAIKCKNSLGNIAKVLSSKKSWRHIAQQIIAIATYDHNKGSLTTQL